MGEKFLRNVVVNIYPQKGNAKTISGLRMAFDFEKTSKSHPNKGSLKIYNLSKDSKSLFESAGVRVGVNAGYLGLSSAGVLGSGKFSSDNTSQIFIGSVTKFEHSQEGPDTITNLELGDGIANFRTARIEKGYGPNAKLTVAINDAIKALGLKKSMAINIKEKVFGNGLVLSGLAKDQLDKLCQANDLQWSIQNEAVQIVPKASGSNEAIILLDSTSGLIGQPKKTKSGFAFDCLLDPNLTPDRKVEINSSVLKGIFKLKIVKHVGDSHEGTFLSKCEAVR